MQGECPTHCAVPPAPTLQVFMLTVRLLETFAAASAQTQFTESLPTPLQELTHLFWKCEGIAKWTSCKFREVGLSPAPFCSKSGHYPELEASSSCVTSSSHNHISSHAASPTQTTLVLRLAASWNQSISTLRGRLSCILPTYPGSILNIPSSQSFKLTRSDP